MAYATVDGTEEDALLRCLWLNVILRAVEDARGHDMMVETLVQERSSIMRARAWLSHPSFDLRIVCEFAGCDYRKLLEKYGGYRRGMSDE